MLNSSSLRSVATLIALSSLLGCSDTKPSVAIPVDALGGTEGETGGTGPDNDDPRHHTLQWLVRMRVEPIFAGMAMTIGERCRWKSKRATRCPTRC